MSEDHKAALLSKCSSKKKVAMPNFQDSAQQTPCSHTLSVPLGTTGMDHQTAKPTLTANNDKTNKKPSKSALLLHQKWQETAESMGGPGARIVVSKPAAKQIIFDFMFDSFAPMNITQIFKV